MKAKQKPEGYVFGRPTDYDPSFCQIAIEMMTEGKSRAEVAKRFGVVRKTLTDWEQKYPDFCYAMQFGEELSECWWKEHGQGNIYNKEFNTKLWDINMMNRFKWSRREQTEGTLTVKVHEDMLKELE